jgi:hypothetical protein
MWLKIERGLRYEELGKAGDCGCLADGFHNNCDHVNDVYFIKERMKTYGLRSTPWMTTTRFTPPV